MSIPQARSATPRRSYDSSRRRAMAADNAKAVLAAAADMFATRGWQATGMRDIAAAAGVSVETVYATAGNKTALLLRVIDVGVVGDDEPVPLSERPEFRALGEGSRAERLAAVGGLITESNRRIATLNRAFAHAAAADQELAAHWRDSRARQRAQYTEGVRLVTGRKPRAAVVDGIWALGSPEVYLLLVETAGWSAQQYRTWLVERIDQLLHATTKEKS